MSSIPSHWGKMKLKYVASLKSGDTITSDSITESGEYPVFGGNGIRGYTSAYTHCGKYMLIGRQGALCGNINYASGCFWASEHAVVVDIKSEDEVVWLGEILRSMDLNQYSQSVAQPGIAVDVIANIEIPVPPLIEQRTIAAYLDRETARLDRLVAAKERVLGLLAEKRRALITRAVTRGLDPRAPLRDSGIPWLGEIPVHWEIERTRWLFRERDERSETGEEELLTVSHLTGVTPRS
jgi:type I restriction enzyme S subunit